MKFTHYMNKWLTWCFELSCSRRISSWSSVLNKAEYHCCYDNDNHHNNSNNYAYYYPSVTEILNCLFLTSSNIIQLSIEAGDYLGWVKTTVKIHMMSSILFLHGPIDYFEQSRINHDTHYGFSFNSSQLFACLHWNIKYWNIHPSHEIHEFLKFWH